MYTAAQQALLDLQAIDVKGKSYTRAYLTHEAHKKLKDLAEIEAKLNAQLETVSEKLSALSQRITADRDEIEASQAKISDEKAKLLTLTDARMTQIIIKSLDALTRRVDKLEFDEIGTLQQFEELKATKDTLDEQSAKLQHGIATLTSGLASMKAQVDEKLAELSKERAEAIKDIDPKMLERYNAIIRDKNGVAVEEFIDGAGSACGMKPALMEIEAINAQAGSVTTCPACRRILVVGKIG